MTSNKRKEKKWYIEESLLNITGIWYTGSGLFQTIRMRFGMILNFYFYFLNYHNFLVDIFKQRQIKSNLKISYKG